MSADIEPVIVVSNVNKTYGSLVAVKSLSFTVGKATCFGLLGPNGAGKTTMMKMIYGKCLRDPSPDSSISVFGYDPQRHELDIKYISGVVPQDNNLDEELNVWQNLWVYSKLYGMPRRAARERISELLDFMELGEKSKVKIKELSGGMKRRLIIARALLNNPRLLILDEPTTGLDPQVRHLIWDKLRQLRKEGLSILLTTHYMEEAFQICDAVLIMHKGTKMMEGAPRRLIESHMERFVLEVLSREAFARVSDHPLDPSVRLDDSAVPVRLYSNESARLKGVSEGLGPGEYIIRETNLEDLFLKTTGSHLDEDQ
jgi:lipooligosaccharide transport system ATP-binding protein